MARLQATQITGSLLTTTSVGIGTTSPIYKLDVNGNIASIDQIVLRTASTNAAGMEIGLGRTGNGYAYLDLIGDATYSDYGLRIIRYDSGANTPSAIIHRGTGDFSLQTLEATNIVLITNSNEKMRINSVGNVGIGTSSPAYKLQISSSDAGKLSLAGGTLQNGVRFETAGSGNAFYLFNGDYSTYSGIGIYNIKTATLPFWINNEGNVGINTSNPTYKLDVNGTGRYSGKLTVNDATYAGGILLTTSGDAYISVNRGASSNQAGYQWQSVGTTQWYNYLDNSSNNLFWYGGTVGYAMVLNTDGNLGIGTTNPTSPLQIYRTSNPYIRVTGGGNYSYIRLDDGTSNGYLLKNATSDTSNGALAGALYTYTDNNKAFQHIYAGTPLFTILSTGAVGIGTTAPATNLEIANTNVVTDTVGNLFIRTTNNQAVNIGGQLSMGGYYSASNIYTFASIAGRKENSTSGNVAGYLSLSTCTSGGTNTERMRIDSTGNVGIGTTSPANKLHIEGSVLINGGSAASAFNDLSIGGITGWYAGEAHRINFVYNTAASPIIFTSIESEYISSMAKLHFRNMYNSSAQTGYVMTIQGNGNIGIGTTSPSYRLQLGNLSGTSTATPETLSLGGTYSNTAGSNVKLRVYDDSGTTVGGMNVSLGQIEVNTWSDGKIAFYRGTSQSAIIDANGSLGIGTSSPVTRLHVKGTWVNGEGIVQVDADSGTQYSGLTFQNNGTVKSYFYHDNTNALTFLGTVGTQSLVLATNTAGTDNGRVFIDTGGNVGIGTTTPTAYLHIKNGTSTVAPLGFTSTSAALLTNVTADKMEYDGNSFYLTSAQTVRGAIERLIYSSTSAVTVTSGTDQNLIGTAGQTWMTTIMPANFMVKGRTLRIYAQGTYQGTASDTLSFKFTYGSTFTLYAPNSANAITVSTTNTKQWELTFNLVCTDTTTAAASLFGSRAANAQYGQIMLGDASTTAATTVSAIGLRHNATINTNDTFDNTASNTIGFSCTITAVGSAAATTVVCNRFIIQVLN